MISVCATTLIVVKIVRVNVKNNFIDKIIEVEKLSWPYLILNVICACIFTSYAFKIESVELALINVFSLISNNVLLGIYLYTKPK